MPDWPVIGWLVSIALGWKWPIWAARLFGWVVPIVVAIAIGAGVVAIIYHRGETAGGAKVQTKAVAAHTKSVADARGDERQAQATTDAIGDKVAKANAGTTGLVEATKTEIHNAIANPALAAKPGSNAAAPAVDDERLRASLNAVIDGANRAADAADAQR